MSVDLDRLASEEQRAEVKRLHTRLGRGAIAKRVGMSEWRVRKLLAAMGLRAGRGGRWTEDRPDLAPDGHDGAYTARDYLRDHAGEMGRRRLARDIGCSLGAVQIELHRLDLALSELRTDLTLSVVARLVGWGEDYIRGVVKRKELRASRIDGVLRVHPSSLRRWILADIRRVRWERVAREDVLETVGLIVGEWGVPSDGKVEPARRVTAKGQG